MDRYDKIKVTCKGCIIFSFLISIFKVTEKIVKRVYGLCLPNCIDDRTPEPVSH